MLLEEPGRNVELAVFHVRRLRGMRGLNPKELIDGPLEALLPFTFQSIYHPPTSVRPGVYIGGNRSRKLVYIDGVDRTSQGQLLVEGYDNAETRTSFNPFNPWLRDMADDIWAKMNFAGLEPPEHYDLVGYSAGGAIATVLYDKMVRLQSTFKRKLVTFGAPRAGNQQMQARLSNSPITRWMTNPDPIPLVPPRVTDTPILLVTQPVLTNVRYGNYVHTAGGIEVSPAGITTPRVVPSLAEANPSASLLAWLMGVESEALSAHSLVTYDNWLSQALAISSGPNQLNKNEGQREAVAQEDRRDMNRAERQVLDLIANFAAEQNDVPLHVPGTVLFRAERIGKIWTVTFGGEVVLVAPIERRARSIARSGNAFLRKMPRQALVDPDQVILAMQAYLGAATDPSSGFTPQIRTNLD